MSRSKVNQNNNRLLSKLTFSLELWFWERSEMASWTLYLQALSWKFATYSPSQLVEPLNLADPVVQKPLFLYCKANQIMLAYFQLSKVQILSYQQDTRYWPDIVGLHQEHMWRRRSLTQDILWGLPELCFCSYVRDFILTILSYYLTEAEKDILFIFIHSR